MITAILNKINKGNNKYHCLSATLLFVQIEWLKIVYYI
jgi:hypothetical protein